MITEYYFVFIAKYVITILVYFRHVTKFNFEFNTLLDNI